MSPVTAETRGCSEEQVPRRPELYTVVSSIGIDLLVRDRAVPAPVPDALCSAEAEHRAPDIKNGLWLNSSEPFSPELSTVGG